MAITSYKRKTLHGDEQVLLENLYIANTWWRRLVGLLRTKSLAQNSGLLIKPCNAIHTLGMAYSLDVIFLDQDHIVVGLRENVKPGRFMVRNKKAKQIIEVSAGFIAAHNIKTFDKFKLLDVM